MDEFVRVGYDAHCNHQYREEVAFWALALGISEDEVIEAIEVVGPSVDALLSYVRSPD